MRNTLFVALTFMVLALALTSYPALAIWIPEDGHKMHWPQLPDTIGWDVNCSFDYSPGVAPCCTTTLADDWQCSESGWIKDIHFWGSWRNDMPGTIQVFRIDIFSNAIVGPARPGDLLRSYSVPMDQVHVVLIETPSPHEGWFCPCCGTFEMNDHANYYQYNVFFPNGEWVWQNEGDRYWLSIQAYLGSDGETCWGWKTCLGFHWIGAVFQCENGEWTRLLDPNTNDYLDLAFVINGEPEPLIHVPSLFERGLVILALLLGAVGAIAVIRRRAMRKMV